jgi:hypothetical protein
MLPLYRYKLVCIQCLYRVGLLIVYYCMRNFNVRTYAYIYILMAIAHLIYK